MVDVASKIITGDVLVVAVVSGGVSVVSEVVYGTCSVIMREKTGGGSWVTSQMGQFL